MEYQPKTGAKCSCKRGVERANCSTCEGTGWVIDFRAIREAHAKPPVYSKTAPSDKACLEAWKLIMDTASRHALILSAYGGVATLATPQEQRDAGIRNQVLSAVMMNETDEKEE